jgi:hypothetical protein
VPDDRGVGVGPGDAAGAEGEQERGLLAGLAVCHRRLGWPGGLPCLDGLAQQRVYRLGECGAGLVDGQVQQADRVAGQDLPGVAGDRRVVKVIARTNCSG